jgi:hypothetical protein
MWLPHRELAAVRDPGRIQRDVRRALNQADPLLGHRHGSCAAVFDAGGWPRAAPPNAMKQAAQPRREGREPSFRHGTAGSGAPTAPSTGRTEFRRSNALSPKQKVLFCCFFWSTTSCVYLDLWPS